MTKSRKIYSKIDIHALLEQRGQVAVIWGIEDILAVRPDLADDEAWAVLMECDRRHDCNTGFTWVFIELIAADLYPFSEDSHTGKDGGQP